MIRGIADFTLDYGKCPRWLFERMTRLARVIGIAIIDRFGSKELIKRLADPVWFQSFGCVLAFDWNASGLTTTTMAALKNAFFGLEEDLDIFICGGKRVSRHTPDEIEKWSYKLGLDRDRKERLLYTTRITAKVDSCLIQDGFSIYHHNFIFNKEGFWSVVQQGMNLKFQRARRYHWFGELKKDFLEEPHSGISTQLFLKKALNLVDKSSRKNKLISVEIVNNPLSLVKEIKNIEENKEKVFKYLQLGKDDFLYHNVVDEFSFSTPQFKRSLNLAINSRPRDFESLLMTKGVGPKTIRAISLVAEIVYGAKPSYQDPARYSFAFGGKDGVPYPVDRENYDLTLAVMESAVRKTKGELSLKDKDNVLLRIENLRKKFLLD